MKTRDISIKDSFSMKDKSHAWRIEDDLSIENKDSMAICPL